MARTNAKTAKQGTYAMVTRSHAAANGSTSQADMPTAPTVNAGADADQAPADQPAVAAAAVEKPYGCDKCDKSFASKRILKKHQADVHAGLKCFWGGCQLEFTTELELRKHLVWHNNEASERAGGDRNTCFYPVDGGSKPCGAVVTLRRELHRHTRRHNYSQAKKEAAKQQKAAAGAKGKK